MGSMPVTQKKQSEWHDQWSLMQDTELSLFLDWIHPLLMEDLRGKTILEAGCGGGQHTRMMWPYAKSITAVDLNTIDIARARNAQLSNIEYVEADIATMDLQRTFDVVMSIGVVHHTDDPDKTVQNLIRHLAPNGVLVLWVYSEEGNALMKYTVEPMRKLVFRHLPKKILLMISRLITAALMFPAYTVYRQPLHFLPYYDYARNFRWLSRERNILNVFDKLNAPQVQFISRKRAEAWLDSARFKMRKITPYCGVSWRITAAGK